LLIEWTNSRESSLPVIRSQASTDDLLDAVARLPTEELAVFAERVATLRAERTAAHLSHDETALLLQIERGLPTESRVRYDELVAKRRNESLGADEHAELIALTDTIEHLDAERMEALIALAQMRRTSLGELMHALGIQPARDSR
jgi:hypothetical protein